MGHLLAISRLQLASSLELSSNLYVVWDGFQSVFWSTLVFMLSHS
jgi:hypothetical protein